MKFTNLDSAHAFLNNSTNLKQIHINGFDAEGSKLIKDKKFKGFVVLELTGFDKKMKVTYIRGYILFK